MLGPCELSCPKRLGLGSGLGFSFHRMRVVLRSRRGCID
jgi:hypothetical protein